MLSHQYISAPNTKKENPKCPITALQSILRTSKHRFFTPGSMNLKATCFTGLCIHIVLTELPLSHYKICKKKFRNTIFPCLAGFFFLKRGLLNMQCIHHKNEHICQLLKFENLILNRVLFFNLKIRSSGLFNFRSKYKRKPFLEILTSSGRNNVQLRFCHGFVPQASSFNDFYFRELPIGLA